MNVELQRVDKLKVALASTYQKQINNYFGDEKKALKFLSSVISSVQRTPELLNCEFDTVINSFMVMAQLELMPSDVSGEAYVLPYKGKAQFQLGYQGLVTLFYRAGVKSIVAEIVYEKDTFKYINGVIEHNPDIFASDRGKAIGAYVIVETQQGGKIAKVMKKSDIIDIGKKFSKSFNTSFTPWKEDNDPELWMWKKTVLKQVAKLVPKNETIYKAIAEDNKDSNIEERQKKATEEAESLKMGNLLKDSNEKTNQNQAEVDPA
jgi:recombination protein RecT